MSDAAANKFDNLCKSLSRNDPEVKEVEMFPTFPKGYGQRLGDALVHNTMVSSLQLNFGNLCTENEEAMTTCPASLLQYLQSSPSLEKVVLRWEAGEPSAAVIALQGEILTAMAQNPCILELECNTFVPLPTLASFLTSTTSLQTLDWDVERYTDDNTTAADLATIANGLSSNSSLTDITLRGLGNVQLTETILQSLSSHSTLQTLQLYPIHSSDIRPFFDSLIAFLRTATIRRILFNGVGFDFDKWEGTSEAMRENPNIVRLDLENCEFNWEATEEFMESMRRETRFDEIRRDMGVAISGPPMPSIVKEMALLNVHVTGPFSFVLFGKVIATLLVDSSLDTLAITGLEDRFDHEGKNDFMGFLTGWNAEIRSTHLQLDYMTAHQVSALRRVLNETRYLTSFGIDDFGPSTRYSDIAEALRVNGSVKRFKMADVDLTREHGQSRNIRRIRAYLARNHQLPQLVHNPCLNETDPNAARKTSLLNFPALFTAATVPHKTTPRWIISGLMAASGNAIGGSGKKRSATNGEKTL